MKIRILTALTLMLLAAACAKEPVSISTRSGELQSVETRTHVEPEEVDITIGDAKTECDQVSNCDFSYKVDNWGSDGEDGTYDHAGATITISNSDGGTFDWSISAGYTVCAVIVKGGPTANIYYYDGATSDEGLVAPINPNNGQNYDISHVSFCFSEDNGECWEEETAWTRGDRYVAKGNWAMYSSKTALLGGVDIVADGGSCPTVIGTATLVDNGNGTGTINIVLTGAIFYYDVNDPLLDNNLKVQDYASKPNKTPAPGKFAWKTNIEAGSTTGSITVPLNKFYGIHLDVALPCDHCR